MAFPELKEFQRSIPACAGDPAQSDHVATALGVYPRVCGGSGRCWMFGLPVMGLSPRVRGIRYAGNRLRRR